MTALSSNQPYPGLRPFDSGDEEFFFGRDSQKLGLREKLRTSRLVAVVGRSGCGKSSLVKAGLVPLLRTEFDPDGQPVWHIASIRPRGQPIAELTKELQRLTAEFQPVAAEPGPLPADAGTDAPDLELLRFEKRTFAPKSMAELQRGRIDAILHRSSQGLIEVADELELPESARLLVIVDQFEEIFRFEDPTGRNPDEAIAFVRLLMEAISVENPNVHVILTMRLDFLGDCARFARLPEAISDGQYLVPNLSRAERRAAIEEPAQKSGKIVRPEVTQRLLNEIGEDPDQLPVLQHVLMRMWQYAGTNTEITLQDYAGTGGVKEAISRHANQVYDALPSEQHRRAAERLFKAICERDRRGRSVRRATRFDEIEAIVAGDDESMPAAKSESNLRETVEAFRAPDCCFIMPPADEDITPSTLIDISHESLLRGWNKMTGETAPEGWIAEEERNGRIYGGLLETAENESILPAKIARQRKQWWDNARPNEAWSKRYGNKFEAVEAFMQSSASRALIRRVSIFALVATTVVSSLGFSLYSYNSAVNERYNDQYRNELAQENRENLAKLTQAQAQIRAQAQQLDERSRELDQHIRNAQQFLAPRDSKASADLAQLLKGSDANSDNVVQRAVVDPKAAAPTTLSNNIGFMWIGSAPAGNLTTLAGVPVLPGSLKINDQYVTNLDIYLRKGLPDRASYTQQSTLGIMPEGTHIQILDIAPPFPRPTGDQYWAQVKVVKLALSTVYFQFAGGAREQAQQLSKVLQDKGYKIPGEERTGAAAGKREVRYFYAGQKTIADQLATDTTQALQRLGYPSLQVSTAFAGAPTKSNPDGKLELWLEIPPK